MSSSGYDANGNVISFTDSLMGQWSYQCDSLNRVVTRVDTSGGPRAGYSDCFAYDNWGNRTGEADSATACSSSPTATTWVNYSTANQITGTGLMPAGYSYDAAANVLNDGVNEYLYDNEERVCTVQSLVTGGLTGYVYDAAGDRVAMVLFRPMRTPVFITSMVTMYTRRHAGPTHRARSTRSRPSTPHRQRRRRWPASALSMPSRKRYGASPPTSD